MTDHKAFVKKFEHAWRDPIARFARLFHPEGTLFQQGMERPLTRDEITPHVSRVLTLMPDQQIEVKRWAANRDDVFIEWSASATLRNQPIVWSGASRFTLRDGLILEEIAYFDTLPLRAIVDDPTMKRGDLATMALEGSPKSTEE